MLRHSFSHGEAFWWQEQRIPRAFGRARHAAEQRGLPPASARGLCASREMDGAGDPRPDRRPLNARASTMRPETVRAQTRGRTAAPPSPDLPSWHRCPAEDVGVPE